MVIGTVASNPAHAPSTTGRPCVLHRYGEQEFVKIECCLLYVSLWLVFHAFHSFIAYTSQNISPEEWDTASMIHSQIEDTSAPVSMSKTHFASPLGKRDNRRRKRNVRFGSVATLPPITSFSRNSSAYFCTIRTNRQLGGANGCYHLVVDSETQTFAQLEHVHSLSEESRGNFYCGAERESKGITICGCSVRRDVSSHKDPLPIGSGSCRRQRCRCGSDSGEVAEPGVPRDVLDELSHRRA